MPNRQATPVEATTDWHAPYQHQAPTARAEHPSSIFLRLLTPSESICAALEAPRLAPEANPPRGVTKPAPGLGWPMLKRRDNALAST